MIPSRPVPRRTDRLPRDLRRLAAYEQLLLTDPPPAWGACPPAGPLTASEALLEEMFELLSALSARGTSPPPALEDLAHLFILLASIAWPREPAEAASARLAGTLARELAAHPTPAGVPLQDQLGPLRGATSRLYHHLRQPLADHHSVGGVLRPVLDISVRLYYLGDTAGLYRRLEPPDALHRACHRPVRQSPQGRRQPDPPPDPRTPRRARTDRP